MRQASFVGLIYFIKSASAAPILAMQMLCFKTTLWENAAEILYQFLSGISLIWLSLCKLQVHSGDIIMHNTVIKVNQKDPCYQRVGTVRDLGLFTAGRFKL